MSSTKEKQQRNEKIVDDCNDNYEESATGGRDTGAETRPVKIIKIGFEGGSFTLFGWKDKLGEWHFQKETNECVLIDMLADIGDDLGKGTGIYRTEFVTGWNEALKLLNEYPWYRMCPVYVHPEFADLVKSALKDAPEEDQDYIHFEEWDSVCAGKCRF